MGQGMDYAALLQVIARAAPPADRAQGSWCEPLCDTTADVVTRRAAAWVAAATGDRSMPLERFLAVRGMPRDTFLRGLCDVRIVDAAQLPGWARDLLALARDLSSAEGTRSGLTPEQWSAIGGATPINDVLRPLLDLGMGEV